MLFLRKTLVLAAILISLCSPTPFIRIQNFSKQNICYKVEYSNGTGTFPNETVCGEGQGPEIGGFWLDSGQTRGFNATGFDGEHFNGAITAWRNNNTLWGARNEINLLNSSITWYDVDYQYGISGSTCGPANDSSLLSGERDPLGKANAAWNTLNQTMKNQLLAFPQYFNTSKNGSLTSISMHVDAWPYLAPKAIWFFQVVADFKAYMSPGGSTTWPTNSMQETLQKDANIQTLSSPTDQIVITSY